MCCVDRRPATYTHATTPLPTHHQTKSFPLALSLHVPGCASHVGARGELLALAGQALVTLSGGGSNGGSGGCGSRAEFAPLAPGARAARRVAVAPNRAYAAVAEELLPAPAAAAAAAGPGAAAAMGGGAKSTSGGGGVQHGRTTGGGSSGSGTSAAAPQQGGPALRISIYSTKTGKLLRSLPLEPAPAADAHVGGRGSSGGGNSNSNSSSGSGSGAAVSAAVAALSFTGDGRALLIATAAGAMVVWRWHAGKPPVALPPVALPPPFPDASAGKRSGPAAAAAAAAASSAARTPATTVSVTAVSPWDDDLIAVAGPSGAKLLRLDLTAPSAAAAAAVLFEAVAARLERVVADADGGSAAVAATTGSSSGHNGGSSSGGSQGGGGGAAAVTTVAFLVGGLVAFGTAGGAVVFAGEGAPPSALRLTPAPAPVLALAARGRGLVAACDDGVLRLLQPSDAHARPAAAAGKPPAPLAVARTWRFGRRGHAGNSVSSSGGGGWPSPAGPAAVATAAAAVPRVTALSLSATDDEVCLALGAEGRLLLLDLEAEEDGVEDSEEGSSEGGDRGSAAAAAAASGTPLQPAPAQGRRVSVSGRGASLTGSAPEALTAVAAAAASAFAPSAEDEAGAGGGLLWERRGASQQWLGAPAPGGRVTALAAAACQPLLLAVSSAARALRLWDWARRRCVAARTLWEEPLSCALHPGGRVALVGTSERLLALHVTDGDLLPFADLPVRQCSLASFSNAGALFAASGRGNAIYVYDTHAGLGGAVTSPQYAAVAAGASPPPPALPPLTTAAAAAATSGGSSGAGGSGGGAARWLPYRILKGHASGVAAAAWAPGDRRLASCGAGGAAYVWDVASGARLAALDFVEKASVYASVVWAPSCSGGGVGGGGGMPAGQQQAQHTLAAGSGDSGSSVIARTADGRLQRLEGGALVREVAGLGRGFAPLAAAAGGRVLLAAADDGGVVALAWPAAAAEGAGGDSHGSGESAEQPAADAWDEDEDEAMSPPSPSSQQSPVQQRVMPRQARLHFGRVGAMAFLPSQGLLFTAGADDGAVLMSSVSLVLDGRLWDAPPVWDPASLSAAAAGGGSISVAAEGAATGSAAAPPGPPPIELHLLPAPAVAALRSRASELAAALRAQKRDARCQVELAAAALRERQAATEAELDATRRELRAARERLAASLEAAEARERKASSFVGREGWEGQVVLCCVSPAQPSSILSQTFPPPSHPHANNQDRRRHDRRSPRRRRRARGALRGAPGAGGGALRAPARVQGGRRAGSRGGARAPRGRGRSRRRRCRRGGRGAAGW